MLKVKVKVTVEAVEYSVDQSIADVIIAAQNDASAALNQSRYVALCVAKSEIVAKWIVKADKANDFVRNLIMYYFASTPDARDETGSEY